MSILNLIKIKGQVGDVLGALALIKIKIFYINKVFLSTFKYLRSILNVALVFLFVCNFQQQSYATETVTFFYTGAEQTFVVPSGITSIIVDATGAAGGHGATDQNGRGGKGGRVQATLAVTAGEILYIYVGGRGKNTSVNPGTNSLADNLWTKENYQGGFNGGGNGGSIQGGGGGGATDIRRGGNALSNRILVAGSGGGGGGQRRYSQYGGNGGHGGGIIGQTGQRGNSGQGGMGGPGGTQSSGGAAQTNSGAGSLGQGGYGANPGGQSAQRDGGGGGAGYYGGAGGGYKHDDGGGGGGGGSSYVISSATNVTHTQGYTDYEADGSISITYTGPPNTTPTVSNVSASGDENNILEITLNGSDADGDSLTYSVVTTPSNGTVSISGGVATYTPNANYAGSDSFTYKANDSEDDSDTNATVSISIIEADFDDDGINNNTDTDDDGDGVLDENDAFPLDATEFIDTDGDGTGNNADSDDDGDGVLDENDAFPLDIAASLDSDGDYFPDSWNVGYGAINSVTNLQLDTDSNNSETTLDIASMIPEIEEGNKKVGLIGWFSAKPEFIRLQSGKVKRLLNLMSNGIHFTQTITAIMPTYISSENAIEFSGTQHLVFSQPKPDSMTIFIVAKGTGHVWGDSSTFLNLQNQQINVGTGEDTTNYEQHSDASINTDRTTIYVMTSNASNNEVNFKTGYKQLFSKVLLLARKSSDTFYLGKSGVSINNAFEGKMYEMLIYNRILTDDEIEEIQNELSLRWDSSELKSKEIIIDSNYTGTGKGTKVRPYKKLKEALKKIYDGGRVKLKPGTYNDALIITENIIIQSDGGAVILGTPKAEQ
ncbi:MAG: glycine-rich protein [Candidatus Margulisiibacteriota bacterium]